VDLGYQALSRADWDTAVARFNEAIRAQPNGPEGHRGLGLAYGMRGDSGLAIVELTRAIELDPTEATAYRSRGGFYLLKGDYDRAIADCDEAIRRGLKDSATHNNRGYAVLHKGNVEKAISDLTEAIRLDPNAGSPYANRGLAWCSQRAFDRAISDFDEAIRIDRQNVRALRARSGAYFHKGDWDKALADINEVVRLDPRSPDAYMQRASIHVRSRKTGRAVEDFTEAIRLDPKSADAYAGRGICHVWRNECDKAIADFNDAIGLRPKSPCYYEMRGALRIRLGDCTHGIPDIENAIRLNPADPAGTYEPRSGEAISEANRQHGERQLRQMLQDRPAMREHGEEAKALYEWAVSRFAGGDFGQRIVWDASPPPPFATCANHRRSKETPSCIRVAERCSDEKGTSRKRSFEELWHDVVFELYNITNSDDFQRYTKEASEGRLSRESFVAAVMQSESYAAERTRAFYVRVFLPWAQQYGVSTNPYSWGLGLRSDPMESLLQFVTENEPYWRAYSRQYDVIVLHSLARRGDNQEALDMAVEMRKHAETTEERAMISRYSGYCSLQLNRPSSAIEDYNEALRYDPKDVWAILGRGAAYAILRDTEHAVVDYSEAIRLDPSNPDAYLARAKAYDATGDIERAKADYCTAKWLAKLRADDTKVRPGSTGIPEVGKGDRRKATGKSSME